MRTASTEAAIVATVVIVTWNGLAHLQRCLPAVFAQELPSGEAFEVLVVDNASTDGSREYLAKIAARDTRLRILLNDRNEGFASPNNRAFAQARGEFVATLNNDTLPEPGWLAALLAAARVYPRAGSVASRMVFAHAPHMIQSAGITIDRAGIAWDRLAGRPVTESETRPVPIFGASAGAALYRRAMLQELGGFDGRYFMYLEDVDLAWCAQLAGWDAMYAPQAVVRHAHSGSAGEGSPFKNWHLGRNKLWTIAKCYPSPGLVWYLPVIVAYDLASLPFTVVTRRDLSPLRGRLAALYGLGPILAERRRLHRRYPDGWQRTRRWLQPVEPPLTVFRRYQRLRSVLASPSPLPQGEG
ncbi:MAG: glycosyltransferase family 2 protein [Chloroflexi bacterium]|nr:glycosyltransferase family 2 protein [Chloroflexota bacterium]